MISLFLCGFIVLLSQATTSNAVFSNQEEGEKLVRANTEFALDLYRLLSSKKQIAGDNVFFSPMSISMALAMTSLGARNQTPKQMAEVLKFSKMNPDHLHSSFSDLRESLVSGDNFTLEIANKLFGERGLSFLFDFVDATREYYDAELKRMNFSGDPGGSREIINKWVESKTNEKIKDLLGQSDIDATALLVLVNAIYFKGDWKLKFDPEDTQENDFTLENGSTTKVPMMYVGKPFEYGYSRTLNVQALELPYKGDKLSMVVLLPRQPNGIAALEKALTAKHLMNFDVEFGMHEHEVDVLLPRFKLEDSFSLLPTLFEMGLNTSDFSGINCGRSLKISKIIHKSFLEVNEEGSEAAAATAVIIAERGPPMFRANRPFLFFIRDNDSKAVLFFGKYSIPKKS